MEKAWKYLIINGFRENKKKGWMAEHEFFKQIAAKIWKVWDTKSDEIYYYH